MLSNLTILTSRGKEFQRRVISDEVDLAGLLENVVKRANVLGYHKKITVEIKKIPEMIVKGDKIYLEKLFLNLVKNAITYGKDGGSVQVSAAKNKEKVVIKVEDNGIGISQEDLPRIFERFYRAQKTRDAEGKRTGLGLAIAMDAITSHGGRIKLSDSPMGGLQVLIYLPI